MHSLLLAQTHIASALALLAATNDQLKVCTDDQVNISDFDVRTAVKRAHNAADLVVDQLEAIHEALSFSQENGMGDDESKIANLTKRCFVAGRNAMISEREKLLSDIFSADGMLAEFNKRREGAKVQPAPEHQRDSGDETTHEPFVINIAEGKSSASDEKIRQAVDEIKAKASAPAEPELPPEVAQVVDMLKSLGLKVGEIHVIKGGHSPL